jgi:anti-sigma factor RsiW
MSENTKHDSARRDEVEMMLPFYVTGQLDHAEANEIDEYLKHHPDVARQLDLIRAERESTAAGNAIYASRPARSFDRVAAMIGKAPARPARSAGWGLDWIRRLFAMPSSPTLGFVGAAAAIVILLQAATIGTLVVAQYTGIFTGASGGNGTVDAGTTVVVRIGPKTMNESERERLIAALKARSDLIVFVTQTP